MKVVVVLLLLLVYQIVSGEEAEQQEWMLPKADVNQLAADITNGVISRLSDQQCQCSQDSTTGPEIPTYDEVMNDLTSKARIKRNVAKRDFLEPKNGKRRFRPRRSYTFRLKRGGSSDLPKKTDLFDFNWRLKRLGHFNLGWKNGYFYHLGKITRGSGGFVSYAMKNNFFVERALSYIRKR